jgi:polyisoprenoid-binding protein YceI
MTTSDSLQTTLPLIPGRWELDRLHTTVGFTIRHLGVAKVRGRFDGVEADVVIGDRPETSSVTATVDLASVETGQADRDDHIRAADILDVANRPTMTFRSTAVTGDGEDWSVAGDLTIGDVTRPLTLALELGGVADFPVDGTRHAGLTATGELRRRDFGIADGIPAPVLGDVVKIEIDLELIEPR